MEITEVRIKLMEDNSGSNERLQAFCSITFDDMFVIRDLKIIEGAKGFFVAMPSRKLTDRCHNCGTKNHLRSRFCNQCGCRLDENRALRDADGRAKLHADIAHPINSMCREKIQAAVLNSYAEELERSKMPGYVSRYDEYEVDDFDAAIRPACRPADLGRQRAAPAARAPPRPHPSCPRRPVRASRARISPLARRQPPRESAPTTIIAAIRPPSATGFDAAFQSVLTWSLSSRARSGSESHPESSHPEASKVVMGLHSDPTRRTATSPAPGRSRLRHPAKVPP